jgi:hypothetical protein
VNAEPVATEEHSVRPSGRLHIIPGGRTRPATRSTAARSSTGPRRRPTGGTGPVDSQHDGGAGGRRLAANEPVQLRVAVAFTELTHAVWTGIPSRSGTSDDQTGTGHLVDLTNAELHGTTIVTAHALATIRCVPPIQVDKALTLAQATALIAHYWPGATDHPASRPTQPSRNP